MSHRRKITPSTLLSMLALVYAIGIYSGYFIICYLCHHEWTYLFLSGNSPLIYVHTILTITVIYSILLILFFVKPIPGKPLLAYFALNKITIKPLLFWSSLIIIFELVSSFIYHKMGLSLSSWWVSALTTANISTIIWYIIIILAAPIFEELLFRGVLFTGISQSKLGPALAILITSYLWTIPLAQPNIFATVYIFTFGVLLGVARHQTKSTYTPIIMHLLNNLIDAILLLTLFAK